jgi:predicted metalloendopeptidase
MNTNSTAGQLEEMLCLIHKSINNIFSALGYDQKLCTSKGCIRAAAFILSAVNFSVDPCEDFFEYACGQWNHEHPVPDDKARYRILEDVREHVSQKMQC